MKKIILILFLTAFSVSIKAQSPFSGFFKPVDKTSYLAGVTTDRDDLFGTDTHFWLFRPVVSVSAMQFLLENPVKVSTLNSLGTGISYSHFIEQNGEPYQNFAANLLVLFGTEIADVSPVKLSLAGTVSLWQHLNLGIGYCFYDKKAFLLSGINFNFN